MTVDRPVCYCQVMSTKTATDPTRGVGPRAAAGRRRRAVLRRGRAHGRHRPGDRARRRREGVALQHVRQQGRAGPRLPDERPRSPPGAHHARLERYDTPREKLLGVFDVLGEAVAEPTLPRLRVHQRQRRVPPRRQRSKQVCDATRAWMRELFRDLAADAGAADPETSPRSASALRRRGRRCPDGPQPLVRAGRTGDGRDTAGRGDPALTNRGRGCTLCGRSR